MHICLFDIDGTLLHSGGAGKAAMEAALRSAFAAPSGSENISFSGRTDRGILRDMFAHHAIPETPENARRFLDAYLTHLPDCLATHKGVVLQGVVALLDELRQRDRVVLGLLTGNIRAGAGIKLAHYRLADYFAFGGYGDEHFHRDDVAREALAEVHRRHAPPPEPERIWVIGDTPLDVQCARAIGARAVAVATGWHSHAELEAARPDLLLADFSDPGPLLDRLK